MGSTNRKGRRAAEARNKKRAPRAVEHVERFKGAPPEVRQAEYVRRAQLLASFGDEALRVFLTLPQDHDLFKSMATKIDNAVNAIRPRGEIPAARMAILRCIDDAVNFKAQRESIRDLLPAYERVMAAGTEAEVSGEDRRVAMQVIVGCPAFRDAERLRQAGHDVESGETWQFALFLLPLRCMDFAWALRSEEGMRAMKAATEAWLRGPGDHGAAASGPRKWEAANGLMQAAGLVGTTEESLQSEWRAYRRYHEGKLAKN